MRVGATRSQMYDSQKTARARWEQVQAAWDDSIQREFGENTWEPLDQLVNDAMRAIDQLSTVFKQVRRECEGDD